MVVALYVVPGTGVPVQLTGLPTAGFGRKDMGSVAGGMPVTGQFTDVPPQVTVPPPLFVSLPTTPILPASMSTFWPFVVKFPLSSIPHVGACNFGLPPLVTPTPVPGGPRVYTQPGAVPFSPISVATALANTNSVLTPKSLMK